MKKRATMKNRANTICLLNIVDCMLVLKQNVLLIKEFLVCRILCWLYNSGVTVIRMRGLILFGFQM